MPLLAEYFLRNSEISTNRRIRGLSKAACERLATHDWPGNVRELRNVIDRAMILERGQQISGESIVIEDRMPLLPRAVTPEPLAARPVTEETPEKGNALSKNEFSLETAEREFILRALRETGWQRTRAAGLLGITRATLHAKLKRYGIQPPGSSKLEIPAEPVRSRLAEAHA